MTFFDKKLDVMKVELTPYGRYKLSIGRLKPSYYRFFDNNVIYDVNAMNVKPNQVNEDQNDADHRIRQETPILKQNPNVSGVETGIKILETDALTVQMEFGYRDFPDPNAPTTIQNSTALSYRQNFRQNKRDDHINQMVYNIGTIEYDSQQSPSFQVDAFKGKLKSTTSKFYFSKNIQTASIPQIDLNICYEVSTTYGTVDPLDPDVIPIGPFADGSSIVIRRQNPLLRIKETNAFDEKENFHISAFKVYTEPNVFDTNDLLKERLLYEKMNFRRKRQRVVSDLFVETDPVAEPDQFSSREVPYFFELLVDREIAESDYCETIGDLKIRNIYLDNEIICPDQQGGPINVYNSPVTADDLEDCD